MCGALVFRRCLSDAQRKGILLNCLNNKFDKALETIRKVPPSEMDYSILQTMLSRSCHWGHIHTVNHIWYKYVRREHALVVSPPLLCDIATLALNEGKYYLPKQLHYHFKKFFSNEGNLTESRTMEYELVRIKVESFAKGTMTSTDFREKWKVFLEDVDHYFPSDQEFCIWDYTHLTESLSNADDDKIMTMLFTEDLIKVKNTTTLPLLLNMILLQARHHIEYKLTLFKTFHQLYRTLNYDDTLAILFRQCEIAKDGYRMNTLIDYVKDNGMPQLSPIATRILTRGMKSTEYSFKLDQYSGLLSDARWLK